MLARPAPLQSPLFLSLAHWNSVVLWEMILLLAALASFGFRS